MKEIIVPIPWTNRGIRIFIDSPSAEAAFDRLIYELKVWRGDALAVDCERLRRALEEMRR